MKYITHPRETNRLGAPHGWDQSKVSCGSLSVQAAYVQDNPVMYSRWQFEGVEDIAMLLGGSIELGVWSNVHPPVSMLLVWPDAILEAKIGEAIARLKGFAASRGLKVGA